MTPDLKALAARIAAAGARWIVPGVALSTGDRCVGTATDSYGEEQLVWVGPSELPSWNCQAVINAIAAGPDLDDAATFGVLLWLMPEATLNPNGRGWVCAIDRQRLSGDTRAEAIARAWLAANEVAK